MKVIVTGATGRVGSAVLNHCIANPAITSIVVLSRRPIDITSPKLTTLVLKDFLTYDQNTLDQLKGAEGCVWALGSPFSGPTVHTSYTHAAIDAFTEHLLPQLPGGRPFRFVHTSGGLVPYFDSPWFIFLGPNRKFRPDLERSVLAVEAKYPGRWESFIVRPWAVVDEAPTNSFRLIRAYILRPELGAAMTDAALNGSAERIIDNEEMRVRGQKILKSLEK